MPAMGNSMAAEAWVTAEVKSARGTPWAAGRELSPWLRSNSASWQA